MDAIFVGREAELAHLDALVRRAATQASAVALIQAPAGVGKSALLDRFMAQTTEALLVRVSGDEAESAIAFGVHDQLLARLPLDGALRRGATEPRPASTGLRGDLQVTGDALRDRLHAAAAGVGRPCLVLVVDDAHLADRPSLTAIGYALRRLPDEPIVTVLASRPEGTIGLPQGLLTMVDAGGLRLDLQPLSVDEVQELAKRYGHHDLNERAARRLREHTGGNPLHLRALLQDGRLPGGGWLSAPLPAPPPFARLVAVKLGRLSPHARGLARAAAVLGLRCDLRAAAQMAGVADPLRAVDELRSAQIAGVERTPQGLGLVFDHSVIRAAVLQDCGEADLAALHRAAAGVTPGAEALTHLARATVGHDGDLAERLAEQGRADIARGGWRTAADTLMDASRLHPDRSRRDALLVDGVYALLVAGDLAVAAGYRDQVAAVPPTARRLQMQALMAWMSGDFPAAETLAQQAWEHAEDLEPLERDRLAGLLAEMYLLQGKSQAARDWCRTAMSSPLLDPNGRASTLATLVGAMLMDGCADEALTLLPSDGDLNDAGYRELVGMRGFTQLLRDEPAAATEHLRIRLRPNLADHRLGESPVELLTATGPDGLEPNKLVILVLLAEAEFRRGCWDVASAIAEQALGLIADTEQHWMAAWGHAVAVLVPASRGRWESAEAQLSLAQESAARFGIEFTRGYAANAAVHLAWCRGDAERVVSSARWLLEEAQPFHQEPGLHCWPVHYADALVTLGRHDEADDVLRRWEKTAQQRGRRARIAALARVRGDLAARRRDLSAARLAYEAALATPAEDADVLERAVLHLSRGRFLRRRGERRAALTDLHEAYRRFGDLGADPFLGTVRSELAACGIGAEPEAAPQNLLSGLTPQEEAVARLVADGRSNKEIAEALVLSPKTVAYHLGHVYAKVGVRSRSQLLAKRPFDL
jgi:DNA-binding CsgD family transcriptional regulator/predicted negative regulator of RcsB-dependent stress response